MRSRWCNATAFVLTAYAVGCGSEVIVERNDARPAGPPRCHAGYHLVDGVCQVIEVYFAGGTFVMGRNYCPNPIEPRFGSFDERCDLRDEPHTVSVGPFAIDAIEVTSAEAERPNLIAGCPALSTNCLSDYYYWEPVDSGADGGGRPPLQAETICARRGMTLATEAQWEYAASAAGTRTYPWGNAPPSCDVVPLSDAGCPPIDDHLEVARYRPSPEGLYDLAGNSSELVLYDESFGAPGYPDTAQIFTPCGEWSFCKQLITRGGSYASSYPEQRDRWRAAHRETSFLGHAFRCVRNP